MGLPGVGKGTQAELIVKKYNVVHVSTGEIFRQALEENTSLGQEAKKYLDAGSLVPDEITIGIVAEKLQSLNQDKGFLLDGFPRTVEQALALDECLTNLNRKLDCCLQVEIEQKFLVKRLTGRRICKNCGATYHLLFRPSKKENVCDRCGGALYQRDDDNEKTVKARLEINSSQVTPILSYYKNSGVLFEVDGLQVVEKVFADIENILDNLE